MFIPVTMQSGFYIDCIKDFKLLNRKNYSLPKVLNAYFDDQSETEYYNK